MIYFFLSIFLCAQLAANDIVGFWTTINNKTKKPQSIVAIYEYKGMYYGRMIGSFDSATGKVDDTLETPDSRAPGLDGHPYYMGLDFIYKLKKSDSRYRGYIVDPRDGNEYKAELWVENGNLIVQGKYLFFWRNQTWPPFTNFNETLPKPDVSKFVPVVPKKDDD